jgi:hypothetical protein
MDQQLFQVVPAQHAHDQRDAVLYETDASTFVALPSTSPMAIQFSPEKVKESGIGVGSAL